MPSNHIYEYIYKCIMFDFEYGCCKNNFSWV